MLQTALAYRVGVRITLAALLLAGSSRAAGEAAKGGKTSVKGDAAAVSASAGKQRTPSSPLRPVLGVGPGFYSEDTDRVQDRHVNGQRQGEVDREERIGDGFVTLQAWMLFPWLFERLRAGGGLAWYNAYALAFDDEDREDDVYHVGHTFQLFGQAEYVLLDVASKLDVFFGLRGGGVVVFSGSEVQDELDFYEQQGFDVWQTPRLGAMISPHVGGTWPLNERLSLRADLGAQFQRIWLYDAEAEAGGSLIEVESHLATTRYLLLVGLEFGL